MTQPEHPFTDLPIFEFYVWPFEVATKEHAGRWIINVGNGGKITVEIKGMGWIASSIPMDDCHFCCFRICPNEAFQALRQAVRELANDLGVG